MHIQCYNYIVNPHLVRMMIIGEVRIQVSNCIMHYQKGNQINFYRLLLNSMSSLFPKSSHEFLAGKPSSS